MFFSCFRIVVAPKHMDVGSATTKTSSEEGSLAAPTAPQRTDADPNRYGEPMNRPKRNTHPLGRGGGQKHQIIWANQTYPVISNLTKSCGFD